MDDSDNARLLESAVTTNNATDLFRWYKAVSQLSPYWTRQADVYRPWGRQTSEHQPPLTPWRLMSHLLEEERTAFNELHVARLALEFIARIDDSGHLFDLRSLLDAQDAENRREIEPVVQGIEEFHEGGLHKEDLPTLRSKVLRGHGEAKRATTLSPEELKALILDAHGWLEVVKGYIHGGALSDDSDHHWRMALPFLDSAESKYVRKPEAHLSVRRTSVWLVQRRLTSFPGATKKFATLFDYAHDRKDAQIIRDAKLSDPNLDNPIKGDPPAYL